jgi:hypothetical protein
MRLHLGLANNIELRFKLTTVVPLCRNASRDEDTNIVGLNPAKTRLNWLGVFIQKLSLSLSLSLS